MRPTRSGPSATSTSTSRAGCYPWSCGGSAGIALLPLDETTLRSAETLAPPGVATLDAIHLASALRVADADLLGALMTYDSRLAAGAAAHGLPVVGSA